MYDNAPWVYNIYSGEDSQSYLLIHFIFIEELLILAIENKTVAWLISNLRTNDFEELFSTELASTRMRAGVCISGCRKNKITVLPPNYRKPEHNPSMVFMAKFVPDSNTGQFLDDGGRRKDLWLKKIELLEKKGCQLILDYTDNHFSKEGIVGDFYRQIKDSVSGLILPSEKMAQNISQEWNGYTKIIPEPVEVDFLDPERPKPPLDQMTALWFGHVSNLSYLLDYMGNELHKNPPKNLIILTNNMPSQAVQEGAKRAPKGLNIKLAHWSKNNMRKAAKVSHYALIPSSKNDPRKSGVSPGRLLTSFALGLPVIAENLHSYLAFSEFYAPTRSVEALELAKNPVKYHDKVKRVQAIIKTNFTVDAIEKEWVGVVKELLS